MRGLEGEAWRGVAFSFGQNSFQVSLGGRVVARGAPDFPFASVGVGRESIQMYRGNFDIQDDIDERLALTDVQAHVGGAAVGTAVGADSLSVRLSRAGLYPLDLVFSERDGRLVLKVGPLPDGANRLWLRLPAEAGEHVYGCGEQFSHFDLRGKRFPLWTSEQGVGRNKGTAITFQADVQDKAGGDYWWTFFPQPTFVSSRSYYCHAQTSLYSVFDFRNPRFHELHFWGSPGELIFSAAPSMLSLVSDLSHLLGRQRDLPDWAYDGVILGIQGGTDVCLSKLDKARIHGVPVAGIWAQDWEGIRMTSFGKRLMWDWRWDEALYPNLDRIVSELKADGVRFLGYINPYVAADKSLFQEAEAAGYLAKKADGTVYLVDFGEFDAGIVDFTNPEASRWYRSVIKGNLIDFGLSGWMADFGEYLPHDAVLYDGRSAMEAHNQWPALWSELNSQAIEESLKEDDILFFMRAGFTGSQRSCPLMWAGDQNVDWSVDDGLPSVIPAALSLAMSGCGLHHSDLGGYTTLFGMRRTKELHQRWAELAAFTPLMRGHEGNRPGDNWQFDSDDETLDHLASMGKVHVALKPYLKAAVRENAESGIPVQRPLFLHYGEDERAWIIQDQYLLGRDLLVAPVLEEGALSRRLWLPTDSWVHLWSGSSHGAGELEVSAPIGAPPVYYRASSPFSALFSSLKGFA